MTRTRILMTGLCMAVGIAAAVVPAHAYTGYSSSYSAYNPYPYDMFPPFNDGPVYKPNYVAPAAPPPPAPVTYVDNDAGRYCRAYSQTTRIGKDVHETYGTACLQADGSWHVVPPNQ